MRRTPTGAVAWGGADGPTVRLPWLRLDVRADDDSLRRELGRALVKFVRADEEPSPSLEVVLSMGVEAATPPAAERILREANLHFQFVAGAVGRDRSRFATRDGSVVELDLAARRMEAHLRRAVFTAPYSTWADLIAAPLAEVWRSAGCFPLHAGAVDLEGRAIVLPAGSGSGKTTLALALTGAGARWRADDKLLLRERGEGVEARSLYRNANVAPRTASAFAELGFVHELPPLDETNDKRSVALAELRPGAVDLGAFAVGAIAFPELAAGASRTEVVPVGGAEALWRLAAQSPVSAVPELHAAQLRCLARLVRSAPAHVVRLGPDLLARPAEVGAEVAARLRGVGE